MELPHLLGVFASTEFSQSKYTGTDWLRFQHISVFASSLQPEL
jgi:hypothetical protein